VVRGGRRGGVGRGEGGRRPAEIGDGKDNAELAAFTGDFIDDHGVLLLGKGHLKSRTRVRAYSTHSTWGLEVSRGLWLAFYDFSKFL